MAYYPPSGCVHAANPSPLPGIWPLNQEPQLPAPTRPGGGAEKPLRLVSAVWHRSCVRESLCFALCTPIATLSSMAPKLPHHHPPSPPVKGFPSAWKLFLLHSSLPEVQVLSLFFCLCFFFFLLPYPGMWGVSCLLGSLRPSASVSRCSVGVVPHVDVFLMYLWGGRWSPCLTPPSSWRSSCYNWLLCTMLVFFNLVIIAY